MLYSIFFIMKYQQFWQQLRLPLMFVYMYMCISVYVGQSYCWYCICNCIPCI